MNDSVEPPTSGPATQVWTLSDRGRDLAVEMWSAEGRNHARLLIDGVEVDAGDTDAIGDVKLVGAGAHVKVGFWWRGRVGSCDLFDRADDAPAPEKSEDAFRAVRLVTTKVPFAPPPGTRAARSHAWREGHPELWAARHVVIQIGSILLVVLGISALVNALLNRLLPKIDLPSIPVPDWLRFLDPFHWIAKLIPDWDWFGWVPEFDVPDLGWVKYVVLVLFAIATGVREVRKRRAREEREQQAGRATDQDPSGEPQSNQGSAQGGHDGPGQTEA